VGENTFDVAPVVEQLLAEARIRILQELDRV
jgi:hypothetical protein